MCYNIENLIFLAKFPTKSNWTLHWVGLTDLAGAWPRDDPDGLSRVMQRWSRAFKLIAPLQGFHYFIGLRHRALPYVDANAPLGRYGFKYDNNF